MALTYLFTFVSRAKALESNTFGTTWSTNAYQLIEKHFLARSLPGDKKDLVGGGRVYRIHETHAKRLDLNTSSQRVIETTLGTFVFTTADPSAGVALRDDVWLPIGP